MNFSSLFISFKVWCTSRASKLQNKKQTVKIYVNYTHLNFKAKTFSFSRRFTQTRNPIKSNCQSPGRAVKNDTIVYLIWQPTYFLSKRFFIDIFDFPAYVNPWNRPGNFSHPISASHRPSCLKRQTPGRLFNSVACFSLGNNSSGFVPYSRCCKLCEG